MSRQGTFNRVRKLMIVLLSGVAAAFLAAGFMIYKYNSNGGFTLGQILLNAEVAEGLSYQDVAGQGGKKEQYIFDHIELLYFNEETGEWRRKQVVPESYSLLYQSIASDQSLTLITEALQDSFYQGNPAILTLVVKKEVPPGGAQGTKAFQEVQFSPKGDYYRVQLHEQSDTVRWAYFYHRGIYSKLLETLAR